MVGEKVRKLYLGPHFKIRIEGHHLKRGMWSNKTYSFLLLGISGIGTFSNFKCFKYIKKTFDTKGNVFYILVLDSLINCSCNGLYFATSSINLVNEDLINNKVGCIIQMSGNFLPSTLAPVISLLISLCRYVQLKYPLLVPYNSVLVKRLINVVIGAGTVYYLSFLFLDTFLDMKNLNYLEQCQGNTSTEEISNVSHILLILFLLNTIP